MGSILRKQAGHINKSVHLSHSPAPTISGELPHSGYDQTLHGCGPESSGTFQPWPDSGGHIGPAAACLVEANPVKWPHKYGEEKFVVPFDCLHIEMSALKTLGDWLQGSG